MSLRSRAESEIAISRPYFELLQQLYISPKLRSLLIKEAPSQFFSVITQLARHSLNGSICSSKQFQAKYRKALYLLSDPSTKISDKKLIVTFEVPEFISELYNLCSIALKDDSN